MRKVRLNSGFNYMQTRNLADEARFLGDCAEAIRMFVAQPGPDVVNAVKQTLVEAQKSLDRLNKYANSSSVNSARLPVGSRAESDDASFLEEADSVLGLEDGESIDISKAQLLYNEDTLELMLTDEEEVPDGFDIVGTVVETEDTENDAEETEDATADKSSEEKSEKEPESAEDTDTKGETSDESAESAAPAEESEGGIF